MERIKLYAAKLKRYGSSQTGGMDQGLDLIINQVDASVMALQNGVDANTIAIQRSMDDLKDGYDRMIQGYSETVQNVIGISHDVRKFVDIQEAKRKSLIRDLDRAVDRFTDVDAYVTAVGIESLIHRIAPHNTGDDLSFPSADQFNALRQLSDIYDTPHGVDSHAFKYLDKSPSLDKHLADRIRAGLDFMFYVNRMLENDPDRTHPSLGVIDFMKKEQPGVYLSYVNGELKRINKTRANAWVDAINEPERYPRVTG